MSRCALAIVSLLLGSMQASAAHRQIPMADFVQHLWDARDKGLPHPGVTALLQTRDRYLWVGTYAGIARFDGVDFQTFRVPGIPALTDHVKCLLESADGAVWIGTRREGVVRIREGFQAFGVKEGITGEVQALASTADGTVFIGTTTTLVARDRDGRFRTLGSADGLPSTNVFSMYTDVDGTLWVGTSEFGLAWYDGSRFHHVPLGLAADAFASSPITGTRFRSVSVITRDAGGVFWVGTRRGLARRRGEAWTTFDVKSGLPHDTVRSLAEGPDGTLWVGTVDGLAAYRDGRFTVYKGTDLPYSIRTIAIDREGRVIVGAPEGLDRLENGKLVRFRPRSATCDRAGANGLIVRSDGSLWMAGTRALVDLGGSEPGCCTGCCPSARRARRSGTTPATGTRSRPTSASARARSSATASARNA